jgi:hypothetical protein
MSDYIPFHATIFRGDGDTVHFRNWNIAGTPVDITNWVIFHTAKKRLEDSDDDAEINRDSDNDPTAIAKYDNNTNGFPDSFSVSWLPADTATMTPRDYFQDVQIIDGAGPPHTRAYGTLTITGDVTKRVDT